MQKQFGARNGAFTAVTLFLLLVLAACGGGEGSGDVEATGSESVGDILPTPITGAKALPTRANATTLTPDILIIAPSSVITAVDLITVSTQLALPNAHFALVLYGDSDLAGSFDFAADVAEATAVPNAPAQTAITLPAALAAGLQLPGWRAGSTPRLILLLVEGTTPPDEEMLSLAATAVSQNMRLYILTTAESADWAEVAEMGNGRVLLLPDGPTPGELSAAITSIIAADSTMPLP